MNLELLDPFGRQVPDRIDATIDLPGALHFRSHDGREEKHKGASNTEATDWKAAYHVAFNRRGTYIAVGYGSGTVAVHNFLSRTLSALYRNADASASPSNPGVGISSVSWSRRSRTLLAGSSGDATVNLFDTTHPHGPEEANAAVLLDDKDAEDDAPSRDYHSREDRLVSHSFEQTQITSFVDIDQRFNFVKESRQLTPLTVRIGEAVPARKLRQGDVQSDERFLKRYPAVTFQLPEKVSGSLQVNPRIPTAGLAVLDNGSLILFWQHPSVWVDVDGYEVAEPILVPLWENQKQHITCAAFDPRGDRIYAGTKDGRTLGFDVSNFWKILTRENTGRKLPSVKPHFDIAIPGASTCWHLLVSRNGKFFVINSADGAVRLFSTQQCWENPNQKPTWVFQDVVSKVKFVSCDLSGDGEYIVGGANGGDFKYELYIWNTSTGALIDKLTGPSVQLYSVAWHPTRSFVVVATSDGLLDIWGPHINWTNFAPDFQALPMNVEYVEGEDELDVDEEGKFHGDKENVKDLEDNENVLVDVCKVEPVPVFASDSENEEEVFVFETKISNLLLGRRFAKSTAIDD